MIRRIVCLSFVLILLLPFSKVAAITTQQQQSIYGDSEYYIPGGVCNSSATSTGLSSGSSVYILGDSITDRAASAYTSTFQQQGVNANLDFADGRGIITPGNQDAANTNNLTGMQAVAQDSSQVKQAGAIVVALGTNDTNNDDTAQNIDQLISSIKAENSTAPIYWVNVFAINSSILSSAQVGQINTVISGEASKDNYQVINWFNTVDPSGNPEQPSSPEVDPNSYIDNSDGYGVHPDPAGVSALVNLVVNQVMGSNSSSSSSSSGGSSSSCCAASVSGPSAGGPLLDVQFPQVANTAAFATNINNFYQTKYPGSPLIGLGSVFVQAGEKYDVNPALIVGISVAESTAGEHEVSGSYDAWGLTQPDDVPGYPFNQEIIFPSWTVGIYGASMYVGTHYALPGSPYYSTTVQQLFVHYNENNQAEATEVLQAMSSVVNGLSASGGSTSTTGATGSATTGNSSCSSTSTTTSSGSSSGLTNPFPDGWAPGRLDMGYDGHFTTEIVSPCAGSVTYDYPDTDHDSNGGWEGAFFTVQCSQTLSGLPSNAFYFAEGVQPTVTKGQSVTAGQQIAVPGWTGYQEGPGGIEWGLADPSSPGETLAESGVDGYSQAGCPKNGASKSMVLNFDSWLQQNLGVAGYNVSDSSNRPGCA